MIPKIIHYCWFGHNPLPESAQKCIASWRKFFPDYEIKEWNEDNFDVNMVPYTAEAYSAKKYAFVSDYARFWILYRYGGLYFDTDVEVIKPMEDIIERGPFMGIEVESKDTGNGPSVPMVAPGLALGAEPNMDIYKILIQYYSELHFLDKDGNQNLVTSVKHLTGILVQNGLQASNGLQNVAGIWIYPRDYFNPLDSLTGRLKLTENTRSIHWYMNSWSDTSKLYRWLSKMSHRFLGVNSLNWLKKIIHK